MRPTALLLCQLLCCLAVLGGCASQSSFVHSDAALGRVVIYRNGVAYFERYAEVEGSTLALAVPADKVDDFLKSLTVVDATTGKPAPVAFPTSPDHDKEQGSGLIDMKIQLNGPAPHRLRVSYVTEAPSWKPTYRVHLGQGGKVTLQGWAIVDNTSGEDWNAVKLGVGSSSALSFRFDLRSIRSVRRETLEADDLFAQAPPVGATVHGNAVSEVSKAPPQTKAYAYQFDDDPLSSGPLSDRKPSVSFKSAPQGVPLARNHSEPMDKKRDPDASKPEAEARIEALKRSGATLVVEGYADERDGDKEAAALQRANKVRDRLVKEGIAPERVVVVTRGLGPAGKGAARVVEDPSAARSGTARSLVSQTPPAAAVPAEPIGASHFDSPTPMSVPRGTSAMVSILASETEGEVVYLYDAESARGNATFPFRAVRLRNPSGSALESGPVSVFGDGRFIGEGLCDPIPARATAFVPFALDRQIVVERKEDDSDRIARVLAVQRGVLSTEVQRTRNVTFSIHNRASERATVYLRHTVPRGHSLVSAPPKHERVGEAHLFRVEVEPGAKMEVAIEQATPVTRTTDIRSPDGLGLVRAFVSSAAAEGPLRAALAGVVQASEDVGNLEQQIAIVREQLAEYRQRIDELAGQLVALKAVKTPQTPLVQALEKKLADMNDRASRSTLSVVSLQEKLMVAKIRFQDGVAELSLDSSPSGGARMPAK